MTWGAVAAAGIVATGALVGGKMQSDAAKKAAREQRKAAGKAIDAQEEQFAQMQALLQPYVAAGKTALSEQMALLGMAQKPSGPFAGLYKWGGGMTERGRELAGMTQEEYAAQQQQAAIDRIAQSPELQALTQRGEEAIMRRAAATGGLRSGNVQAALGQFAPSMLQAAIDRRYSQLQGLTGAGQNAAVGLGGFGQGTAGSLSDLYQQQGAAAAGSTLAQGQAQANIMSGLGQAAGMGLGMYMNRPQTPVAPYSVSQPQVSPTTGFDYGQFNTNLNISPYGGS
jgi:hypothetical protein